MLEKYHEGIIALSACLAGEIPNKILKEDFDGARAAANKMRDIFGENNLFSSLYTKKQVMWNRIFLSDIMHIICDNHRNPKFPGKTNQAGIYLGLLTNSMILQL